MHTKIMKWGNSQGIRIPVNVLRDSGFFIGEEIEICVENSHIILKPLYEKEKFDINKLLEECSEYKADELEWGQKEGKEEW